MFLDSHYNNNNRRTVYFATDWDLIALKGTDGADGVMASVVAGTGISVDSTDPANPIVTADLSKVDTKPTDLLISTASKGGVFKLMDLK